MTLSTNQTVEALQFTYRRRALVKALRSGDYKQGRSALHILYDSVHKYCCLGVACEVSMKLGLDLITRQLAGSLDWYYQTKEHPSKESALLPREVVEYYRFSTAGGSFKMGGKVDSLTSLNDAGTKFPAIADLIESEPEGMFTVPSCL